VAFLVQAKISGTLRLKKVTAYSGLGTANSGKGNKIVDAEIESQSIVVETDSDIGLWSDGLFTFRGNQDNDEYLENYAGVASEFELECTVASKCLEVWSD
jgi:Tat protein secretion system quality control protein TatD with DNase activity